MNDYVAIIDALNEMGADMASAAEDAKVVLERVKAIRKRSEEVEKLVNECLTLIGA